MVSNGKNPPKMRSKKFGKLTYDCSSLTNFQYKGHAMPKNENHVSLLKFSRKNSWSHIKWTYFRRFLATWNHSAPQSAASKTCLRHRIGVISRSGPGKLPAAKPNRARNNLRQIESSYVHCKSALDRALAHWATKTSQTSWRQVKP